MTNLSKELCEICGIEYEKTITDDPETFVPYKTTLDFTKPENFVRLFNLITTIEDYSYRTGLYCIRYIPSYRQLSCLSTDENEYESENTDPIQAFITCVINCVRAEKDTADYIREAEWVYGQIKDT